MRTKRPHLGTHVVDGNIFLNIPHEHPLYALALAERERLEKLTGVRLSWSQVFMAVFSNLKHDSE